MARTVRARVRAEREQRLEDLAREELDNYRQEKEVELAVLQEEYHRCLADIGAGQEAAREHQRHADFLRRIGEVRAEEARERGRQAMRRAREREELKEKV